MKLSTGLAISLLGDYGFVRMMDRGVIYVYSGAQPSSADDAPTGELLGFVSQDGYPFSTETNHISGLRLVQTGATLVADGNWIFTATQSGIPGWWRYCWSKDDPGEESTFHPRLDGAIGQSLFLKEAVVAGEKEPLFSFIIKFA